ncbi:MAG TPA: hypothetical protein PKA63_00150 [Oligoflexia bacterium]|nr:hypothetical protein [Oligoflexia bacterium]HMP47059.1 hypothetical protein [Oligoflexia bacterium]
MRISQLTNYNLRASSQKISGQPVPISVKAPISKEEATLSISNISTRQRLEKHLNDHKSGQGHLSREMYGQVARMRKDNFDTLAGMNPDAAAMNSAYQTLHDTYDKKARNAAYMKTALGQIKNLLSAYSDSEEE